MPFVNVQVSGVVAEDTKKTLLAALSRIMSDTLGKPEQYVMAALETGAIIMSGKEGPAAFVDVRSIGKLNSKTNSPLAQKLSDALSASLGIPANRIFLNFTDVPAADWAWNKETFG